MKKSITLLSCFFLLSIVLFAQKPNSNYEKYSKYLNQSGKANTSSFSISNSQSFIDLENPIKQKRILITPKAFLDSVEYQKIDTATNTFKFNSSDRIFYDSNYRLSKMFSYYWSPDSLKMLQYYKRELVYDSSGNCTIDCDYNWNSDSNSWDTSYFSTATFDSFGNIIQSQLSIGSFDNYLFKTENIYDSLNRLIQEIYSEPDMYSIWENRIKRIYTYNSNSYKIEMLEYFYDATITQWYFANKFEFTYDSQNNLIMETGKNWNNQWVNTWKMACTYNSYNNLTQVINSGWDTISNVWVYGNKTDLVYDAFGNIFQYYNCEWSATTNLWICGSKYESTYNNSFSFYDLAIGYYYYFNMFNHMLLSTTDSWFSGQWNPNRKTNYYYNIQNPIGISEVEKTNLKIYPNPANDFVVFEIEKEINSGVELYNLQGKKVLTQNLTSDNRISIKQFPSGLYIYKVVLKDKVLSGKIIIE